MPATRSPTASAACSGGARPGRQVPRETHGQFAFHAGADIVGEPQGGAAAMDVADRHEPGGRAAEAEILLHPPGGRADLEAAGRAGAAAMRQRKLHGRAFGLGARRDAGRQGDDLRAPLAGLMQRGGSLVRLDSWSCAPRQLVERHRCGGGDIQALHLARHAQAGDLVTGFARQPAQAFALGAEYQRDAAPFQRRARTAWRRRCRGRPSRCRPPSTRSACGRC